MNEPILVVVQKRVKRFYLIAVMQFNALNLLLGYIFVMKPHRFGIVIASIESVSADPVLIFCSD
ncbi:hypothetical protein D3C71_2103900 [compost metagenome]